MSMARMVKIKITPEIKAYLVERARHAGKKGMEKLTKEERSARALLAVTARWAKRKSKVA